MRIPLPLLFLALPLVEIAGFVVVGGAVGVLPTLLLAMGMSLAGLVLLRVQGLGALGRIRSLLEAGKDPSRELAHGMMIVVAGILLIIPGFVSDAIGLLLFLPLLRDVAWRMLRHAIVVHTMGDPRRSRPRRPQGSRTIDLEEHEYTARSDTPWRRLDDS